MSETLPPPFPWFGGKSRVAPLVWRYLGDVQHFVDPFFGSGAVLFARPTPPQVETVNDKDGYLANFWRAVQHDPDAVAHHADTPVNECDLTARHIWLVQNAPERLAALEGDPAFFDAKIAGWWVWGICCWIGSGWCSGNGPWTSVDGQRVHLGRGRGVNRQLPAMNIYGASSAIVRIDSGDLTAYMRALADRLRRVRVCCGDWQRVVTDGALSHGDPVGVFLDPPYDQAIRDSTLYNHEDNVSVAVREWAIEHGDNPRYMIALCGYEGEHAMPDTWRVESWTAGRAYGQSNGATANSVNRGLERVWFSPACVQTAQLRMF